MTEERVPKLPYSARFVVRASRVLTWGEKAVWEELFSLDLGPDGAWISDASLAECLGLDAGTVKNYRFGLRRRKIAQTIPRPGTAQVGWVMRLPAGAAPSDKERKVWGKRAVALALVLDGHLRSMDGTAGGALVATPDVRPSPRRGIDGRNTEIADSAAALGGKGGNPTSVSMRKAQLPPAVREEGVGARAPEQQVGDERPPAVIRAENMALIRLKLGNRLSADERRLVEGWLERHPGWTTAEDVRRRLSA